MCDELSYSGKNMNTSIVKIQKNNLIVGTWDLSQGFEMRHRELRDLVEKHSHRLLKYGDLKRSGLGQKNEFLLEESDSIHDELFVANTHKKTYKIKKRKGGQVEQIMLNYNQYVCLLTILPNTEKCLDFKFLLADEFIRMRKHLINITVQQQNLEWIEKRESGKIERRSSTDAMDDFCLYAKEHGSINYKKYFLIFTKMQHEALFAHEIEQYGYENLRDKLTSEDLDLIRMSDIMIKVGIAEGIKNKVHYKDIYVNVRNKVEAFALSIGRNPLRFIKKEETKCLKNQSKKPLSIGN